MILFGAIRLLVLKTAKREFIKKMSDHNNGILLVPTKLGSIGFRDYVYGKAKVIVAWIGHMRFEHPDGSFKISLGGAMSIVLIGYGDIAKERLINFARKHQHGLMLCVR